MLASWLCRQPKWVGILARILALLVFGYVVVQMGITLYKLLWVLRMLDPRRHTNVFYLPLASQLDKQCPRALVLTTSPDVLHATAKQEAVFRGSFFFSVLAFACRLAGERDMPLLLHHDDKPLSDDLAFLTEIFELDLLFPDLTPFLQERDPENLLVQSLLPSHGLLRERFPLRPPLPTPASAPPDPDSPFQKHQKALALSSLEQAASLDAAADLPDGGGATTRSPSPSLALSADASLEATAEVSYCNQIGLFDPAGRHFCGEDAECDIRWTDGLLLLDGIRRLKPSEEPLPSTEQTLRVSWNLRDYFLHRKWPYEGFKEGLTRVMSTIAKRFPNKRIHHAVFINCPGNKQAHTSLFAPPTCLYHYFPSRPDHVVSFLTQGSPRSEALQMMRSHIVVAEYNFWAMLPAILNRKAISVVLMPDESPAPYRLDHLIFTFPNGTIHPDSNPTWLQLSKKLI